MKLKTEAFPYPVLSPYSSSDNDYIDSAFQCTINATKSKDQDGNEFIKIEFDIMLSNDEIKSLIKNKKASYSLEVTCSSTGYKKIFNLENENGFVNIPIDDLYQRVVIYPLIIIKTDVVDYSSRDLNPEYIISSTKESKNYRKFKLKQGDMIAFDEPTVKYLDYEPLGIKSLLKVVLDEELDPDSYSIDTNDDNELIIRMGQDLRKMWGEHETKELLYMPVIKDCILIALDEYRKDKEAIIEKKWANLFLEIIDRNERIDEDISVNDLNLIAQEISKKFGLLKIKQKVVE